MATNKSEYMRDWYQRNKEREQARSRRSRRLASGVIGATGETRAGQCAICHAHADPLCLDHDHQTGLPRGWLCGRCNKALGLLDDSQERLAAAAAYLAQTRLVCYYDMERMCQNC